MNNVHYTNSQWLVTDIGIEPRPGIPYAEILSSTLLDIRDDGHSRLYDWPLQIEEKLWADLPAFIDVWLFAIAHFHARSVDWERVARTLRSAGKRRIRQLEDELGEAAEKIPQYYERSFRALDGSDLDLTHHAGKRWRESRYAVATERPQTAHQEKGLE